jgi:hypothetical protein
MAFTQFRTEAGETSVQVLDPAGNIALSSTPKQLPFVQQTISSPTVTSSELTLGKIAVIQFGMKSSVLYKSPWTFLVEFPPEFQKGVLSCTSNSMASPTCSLNGSTLTVIRHYNTDHFHKFGPPCKLCDSFHRWWHNSAFV